MKQTIENNPIGLKKSITWVRGSAVTVGGVLGAGILALPAIAAEMAGPASLVSWVLMGLFSLPMVIVIGMMSSRFPNSGGMADYVERGFGKFIGHIAGILVVSAMPFGMPITALIGANYLGSAFSWSSASIHIAAGLLILAAVMLNYMGVELSGKVQVAVISVIIMILTFTVGSSISQIKLSEFTPFVPNGWLEAGKAMNLLFFAFMGWEMVGHLAEEFYNPKRDIPVSIGAGFIIINIIYLSIAFVTVGSGVYKSGNSATAMIDLISNRWGSSAGTIIAFLGFIICYCAVHTYIAGVSRLIYAQAREGNFPEVFAKLHPKYQSPYVALVSFIPLFIAILFFSFIFSWQLKALLSIPSTTFLMVYILSMAASIKVLPSRVGKISALISAVSCSIVFIFSGKFVLYPLMVFFITFLIKKKYRSGISERSCHR